MMKYGLGVGLACMAAMGALTASAEGFVTADGPRLLLNGAEYRAIGVNVPHLHQAYMGTWLHNEEMYGSNEAARAAMVEAIRDAGESNVAFIRFFANPGYPRDMDLLFIPDPESYWAQMDDVFALCREHGVKLIPSLNAMPNFFADYYQEPKQAILDPDTKTYQACYTYIRDFVSRYKDDPTVLMWELRNEAMLGADVDRAGQKALPPGCFTDGVEPQAEYTREDSLTFDMLLRIYRDQTAFIKDIDPNHLVTSGDACVRPECTSRRETFPDFKFRTDTLREWIANNLLSQPEPLDVASYHWYHKFEDPEPLGGHTVDTLTALVRATHAARVPVFIGEFGQHPDSHERDPQADSLIETIDRLEDEEVSLIALWVWHFTWQPEHTMTSDSYPELIARVAAFNAKHADQ